MYKYLIFIILVFFFSCKDKTETISPIPALTQGVFVTCEGNYTGNNGEISFYNPDTDELTENLYYSVNGIALGDIVQSMIFCNDKAFISVNNSKKIVVVDSQTFEYKGVVTGMNYPRYLLEINTDKVYLTNGSAPGNLIVINTQKLEIEKTINIGMMPENLILAGGKVYIANGAWGKDSTITVINSQTDEIDTSFFAGNGATDLDYDRNGNIWVLCSGKMEYDENWNIISESQSSIVKINPNNYAIDKEILIGETADFYAPMRLAINKNENILYYAEKTGIYSINISEGNALPVKIIEGSYYGLEINPKTGNIYLFADNAFSGPGTMSIYSASGEIIKGNISTGIGPNGAVFK